MQLRNYLHSDEFGFAWNRFFKAPEIADILDWINLRLEIFKELENLANGINQNHPSKIRSRNVQYRSYSWNSFESEIINQIKFDEISDLIDELIGSGNDLAHLYLILKASRPAIESLFMEPEIQQVIESFENLGFDVERYKQFSYQILKWN